MLPDGCPVCGAREFGYHEVLWRSLIDEWQLSAAEADYINIQQGLYCRACSGNLRSLVLAQAICAAMRHRGILRDWVQSPSGRSAAILEINEAGSLTGSFSGLPGHRLARYPEVDIHALPFGEGRFDLVVHSDTLEHVPNPTHALAECRRVLRPGGVLAFTVPIVVGRMTRSRAGLPPSFHGAPGEDRADFLVHTEFGADLWSFIIAAGFQAMTFHTCLYPAGLAVTAHR